ncbi:hypothetical protein MKQ68_22555 [Chitinophaga horti]|uniref:Uncharacterized protein n=1 Tax=Chitinophaga horti TaxID=2920382 RepID=A0ABY6IZR5_9BACT|nr:hypothetical protein [Chitinophaga horti]UYQ92865.1 hypothetical protein MKQ68_22555 [Chitinophaga horti]
MNDQDTFTIRVMFIDADTGQTLGTSSLSPDQLPESFEIPTTLKLGGHNWQVQEADPVTADIFLKTRQLTLMLKRLEEVNPQELFFSLPTISNIVPPVEGWQPYPGFVIQLTDDDWRQSEFINIDKLSLIGSEMDEVKAIRIHESREVDNGLRIFKKIHVRERIGEPQLFIALYELKNLLKTKDVGSISFSGYPGFVKNGFAINTANSCFYGIEENGVVKTLCMHAFNENASREMERVKKAFHLVFVEWCNCNILLP